MLLAVAAIVEAVFLTHDLGTNNFTNFEITSTGAALMGTSAAFVRTSAWRARVGGAAVGAWSAALFAPYFLLKPAAATLVGWLILAGIAAMIAALWFEGRLAGPESARNVGMGFAAGFASMIVVQVAEVAVAVVLSQPFF